MGDLGVPDGASLEASTRLGQLRAGRAMDRAANAAARRQGRVGGVDDRINFQRRDVGRDDLQLGHGPALDTSASNETRRFTFRSVAP